MDVALAAGNSETGSVSPEMLRALNAGLQALPTAFRAHQKTLATFALALLAAPHLHGAAKLEAALLYSLCPRLTGEFKFSMKRAKGTTSSAVAELTEPRS